MRQTPPQSSFDSATARTFRRKRYLPGFAPSSRYHSSASTRAGVPESPLVPSSGDRSLSTVCSALPLVGLFRPTTASRTVPFRGLATPHRIQPHRPDCPPCRSDPKHSPTNRCPRSTPADFEDLLHVKPRFTGSVVKPNQRTRPSSGLVLLQAISQPLPRLTRRQALMTFSDERVTTQAQSLARRFASSVFAARSLTISPR
jgi:hypothetical protein